MNAPDITEAVTNAVYVGLFGMTIAQANEALGLLQGTDEETRRDHMGVLALEALAAVEGAMTDSFKRMPSRVSMSLIQLTTFAQGMGEISANHYADHGIRGADLLTRDEVKS